MIAVGQGPQYSLPLYTRNSLILLQFHLQNLKPSYVALSFTGHSKIKKILDQMEDVDRAFEIKAPSQMDFGVFIILMSNCNNIEIYCRNVLSCKKNP